MLIARMKTNIDDFKYGGKFYRVVEAIQKQGQGWISPRDQLALQTAYSEHIQEAEFSEWVYGEIFTPKEEEDKSQRVYAQMQGQRAQMQNAMQSALVQGTGVYNTALNSGGISTAATKPGGVLTVSANSGMPTITLGQTTLTESMLGQIKNKLGL